MSNLDLHTAAHQAVADVLRANPYGCRRGHCWEIVTEAVQRAMLEHAIELCDRNASAAAKHLGVNRNTVRKLCRRYGIDTQTPSESGRKIGLSRPLKPMPAHVRFDQ